MEEKIVFREMLSEIKELADAKGNYLTIAEIKEFFANAHLTEEQFAMVCEYLTGQKITVEGYEAKPPKPEEEKETEAEREHEPEADHMHLYQEELSEIQAIAETEELELMSQAAAGDAAAKSRLVELYLQTVYDLAQTYRMSDLPVSDLIQEGNVALLLAIDEIGENETLEAYRSEIYRSVSKAMERAIEEQQDDRDMDQKIAERANHLNEAVQNLERDLEHKVSLEELSAYLEMSEKEIRDILRMTGDEIELEADDENR